MTDREFISICMKLWDGNWQQDAADFLCVSKRSVQKFASGERAIPTGVERELYDEAARVGF